jgi:signal transduction protein with GAF and PtsI domain
MQQDLYTPDFEPEKSDEAISENLIEAMFLAVEDIEACAMETDEAIDHVLDIAMGGIDADGGAILLTAPGGQELWVRTACGPRARTMMDQRPRLDAGVIGYCARKGACVAIGQGSPNSRLHRELSEEIGEEVNTLIAAPIVHGPRVYGVMVLTNRQGAKDFDQEEMNALAYLGRRLGAYLYEHAMANEPLE